MKVAAVALDLFREAAYRRWFLALAIVISLVLIGATFALQIEVVDGALAATRLFGRVVDTDIRAADVALRPVYRAVAYVVCYGGVAFGIVACADFAPGLLSPGRIEHLLSLPVRRWELLAGTFAGVMALATAGALYGAGGLTLILSVKTGVWTARPILAALLASVSFAAVYATMLCAAVFVRSAAASAGVGLLVLASGIVAGYRLTIEPAFEPGAAREAFLAATLLLPRVSTMADASADLAASSPVDPRILLTRLAGILVFALAALAVAAWRFEQLDL